MSCSNWPKKKVGNRTGASASVARQVQTPARNQGSSQIEPIRATRIPDKTTPDQRLQGVQTCVIHQSHTPHPVKNGGYRLPILPGTPSDVVLKQDCLAWCSGRRFGLLLDQPSESGHRPKRKLPRNTFDTLDIVSRVLPFFSGYQLPLWPLRPIPSTRAVLRLPTIYVCSFTG